MGLRATQRIFTLVQNNSLRQMSFPLMPDFRPIRALCLSSSKKSLYGMGSLSHRRACRPP